MKKKKNKGGAKKKPIGEVKHRVVVFIELNRINARGGIINAKPDTKDYDKNVEVMKEHLYKSA